ncbi:LCP family protein [Gracilibacillus sp. YIM 98692]|uniref:LCP family protein n=1 Tax=Gracilibacillus sp. YIM 98692 TaxID=2663532 RepID=UPI0013D45735|nr:LCP family protein [Gracilibacillus sp. YIM 98692]
MSNKDKNLRTQMRKRQKKKKRKLLLYILIPLLLIVGAVGSYGFYLVKKAENVASKSFEDDGRENGSEKREKDVDPEQDNVSILFIGIDDSEKRSSNGSSPQLSDALILATLNKEDHSVKMLSIPRDSYVYIPEQGYKTKINHAHSLGGPKSTIETVENFLDVPVDYYVRVNFNAFIDVVNTLDGITVDVPYEFYEQDSQDRKGAIHLTAGEQTLNGEEALALARTRKMDNDIERGKRQQQIMKAIVKRALSLDSVLKYDDIMEAVGNNMKTNMEFSEMRSLMSYGMQGDLDMESYTLEGHDSYINNTYYYQLNEDSVASVQDTLKEHLNIDEDTSINASDNNHGDMELANPAN